MDFEPVCGMYVNMNQPAISGQIYPKKSCQEDDASRKVTNQSHTCQQQTTYTTCISPWILALTEDFRLPTFQDK